MTEHAVTRRCYGITERIARGRSSAGTGVFFLSLLDVAEPPVDRRELLCNARVLAHHAQVFTHADGELQTPPNLGTVSDHFVLDTTLRYDSQMMEVAGAQCLLFAGFSEQQMRRRHNIRWYAELGASFFSRAAAQEQALHQGKLLDSIARRFEVWCQRYERLSRELREQPYLLTPPQPPTIM